MGRRKEEETRLCETHSGQIIFQKHAWPCSELLSMIYLILRRPFSRAITKPLALMLVYKWSSCHVKEGGGVGSNRLSGKE